jgi:hypothetical protein
MRGKWHYHEVDAQRYLIGENETRKRKSNEKVLFMG